MNKHKTINQSNHFLYEAGSTRKIHVKQNKRRFRAARFFILLVTAIVISGVIAFGSFLSLAKDDDMQAPLYKSISIEEGDTLWNLAETYMPEDFKSVSEYVTVIKKINNLSSDKILTGENLIIIY